MLQYYERNVKYNWFLPKHKWADYIVVEFIVPSASDPRRIVGAEFNCLASKLTSHPECNRLFGALSKTRRVNGIFLRVALNRPLSGRATTSLGVKWAMSNGSMVKLVRLSLMKSRPYRTTSSSGSRISWGISHNCDCSRCGMEASRSVRAYWWIYPSYKHSLC